MMRVVVETTRTSIRLLVVEGTPTQPLVRQFMVEPLGEPQRVHRALAALQPARAHLISALARDQVITRLLKLPSTQPEELTQMAALAGKVQLPYPPDQTVTALYVLEQQTGTSTVQLVACHRDLIDRHIALLRQLGGEPGIITPNVWGLLSWYLRFGREPSTPEPVLLVHVDVDHTDVVLIRDGRLVFSRSLSQGVKEWEYSPGGAEQARQEIDYSVSGLRKELPGLEVMSFLITGLGRLDRWKGILEQQWGKPVTLKAPQGGLHLPEPWSLDASPAAALGVALADTDWLVNLVPLRLRQTQRVRRRLRALTITGGLLATALVLGTAGLWLSAHRQEHRLAQLTQEMRQLESTTRQAGRQEQGIKLAQQLLASRHWMASMLAELFQRTPADVFFEHLAFEQARGVLVVRGNAPTTRDVLDYIRALEQSRRWAQVELRYSARRNTTAGATRTDFEMALHR